MMANHKLSQRLLLVLLGLMVVSGVTGCPEASHGSNDALSTADGGGAGDGPAAKLDGPAADAASIGDGGGGLDALASADLEPPPDLKKTSDQAGASPDLLAPPSSVPSDPIAFDKNTPFTLDSGTLNYVFVPDSYDSTHQTPITLFVWLHGCGGYSEGDVWTVSPGDGQTWITLAVGGQEGGCWDMDNDPARVLAAIANLKTHFNIKPRGVIMGGYSSGGDLSYRTAFYNADQFAGILVENTTPFRDTGSTKKASIAAASWKFNVVQLAHIQDDTYPIDTVRTETDALTAAGFPMTRIERDGTHWDDAGAFVNGHSVPGTAADIATYLFPYLDAGWMSP